MSSLFPAFTASLPLQSARLSALRVTQRRTTILTPRTRQTRPQQLHTPRRNNTKCQMPTNVEEIPAERIPSNPAEFPPHWQFPGVYGVYSIHKELQYVAAVRNVAEALATHVRMVKDPERVFAVRMLTVGDVDAVPLGDIAENWVMTHMEHEQIPPGNGDAAPEWRAEEWSPDVFLRRGEEVRGEIRNVLRKHRVVLFMKGKRDAPRCGFSHRTVTILKEVLADEFVCVDCLDGRNEGLREGIKEYADWPTIPQLYVDGDFIGGTDIVADMHENGQLAKLVAPVLKAKKYRELQEAGSQADSPQQPTPVNPPTA